MPTFSCPTCQKPVEWNTEARWRPFCSERCRLIDLGAWMAERHAIPGDEIAPDEQATLPGGDTGPDAPPRH